MLNGNDFATKENLIRYFKEENEWFVELLLTLHELKINRNMPITDILIREGEMIHFSTIKSFQPMKAISAKIREFKPTKEHIINVLKALEKGYGTEITTAEQRNKLSDPMATLAKESIIDFSFAIKGLGIYRCNVSIAEEMFAESGIGIGISMRVLDFDVPDFDKVFYPASYRELIQQEKISRINLVEGYKGFIKSLVASQQVKRPKILPNGAIEEDIIETKTVRTGGLILHVGATGSGKTTAIASEIGFLAKETTGTIITYENPIEYRYIGFKAPVRQYELGYHLKNDSEVVVKHLLRTNPSVVLYGEARTLSEMRTILDIANRGHLIFSTIHANNVKEALGMLLASVKDEPFLLANGLIAIVAHKLILSRKGEIVPLFEVFIPDRVDRTKISEMDLKDVYRRFYQEKTSQIKERFTFKDYIDTLVRERIIDNDMKFELFATAPLVFNPM